MFVSWWGGGAAVGSGGREGGGGSGLLCLLLDLLGLLAGARGLAERSGCPIRPHELLGPRPGVRVAFAALSAFVPDPRRLRRGREGSEAGNMVE